MNISHNGAPFFFFLSFFWRELKFENRILNIENKAEKNMTSFESSGSEPSSEILSYYRTQAQEFEKERQDLLRRVEACEVRRFSRPQRSSLIFTLSGDTSRSKEASVGFTSSKRRGSLF